MTRNTESAQARWIAPDWLLAVAVFLTLFGIYLYTLLPGLGGTEDTAKFQYIGPALGTAHDPGYPFYIIVSWAASKLPVGTLAYRINLLSAFWGATAAAFVFLAMRRVAVPRALAALVAVGLGLGRAFWEHSTYAEAYTQASALTAAAIVALLTWDEQRRDRHLYAAVAATSLAFGTHLIIVGAVPFFVWLVLARSGWRPAPRVVAVSGLIVALGVGQYGYVWIRTAQRAEYLEARASSVGELIDTLRGAEFGDQTFKESSLAIARFRIPAIARVVGTELGAVATPCALLGVLSLWRHRRRSAILLSGAFFGPAVLLSTLGSVATSGIILPALMPLWILAGAGAAWLWSLGRSPGPPRAVRIAAAAVALLAAAVPAAQLRSNLAYNNRRGEVFDTDYYNDLFRRISGPTAFVEENDYVLHQMLEYQRFVTRKSTVAIGVRRDPATLSALLDDGFNVYAFREAAAALEGRVDLRPVALAGGSLNARLAALPDGMLVVVAGVVHRWPTLDAIEIGDRAPTRGGGVVVALKGFGPVIVTPSDFQGVIEIPRGQALGQSDQTARLELRIAVRGLETTIDVEGQRIVQISGGLAVAEIGSRLGDVYEVSPAADGLRTPIDMSRRPLFEVTSVLENDACTWIGDGSWHRLADPGSDGRLIGRIDNSRPFDAAWVIYLTSAHVLRPRLARRSGPGEPTLEAEAFVDGGEAALRARLAQDGLDASPELLSAAVVTRLAVKVNDRGEWSSFRVSLGGQPMAGWGRALTDQQGTQRGLSCSVPADRLAPDMRTQRAPLYLGPGGDWLFGEGWRDAAPMSVGFHRVLDRALGRVLLPLAQVAPISLRVSLESIGGDTLVAVAINGRKPLEARSATAGWNELVWRVDTEGWRPGVNELQLLVTRPGGRAAAVGDPSLRVRSIELDWRPR